MPESPLPVCNSSNKTELALKLMTTELENWMKLHLSLYLFTKLNQPTKRKKFQHQYNYYLLLLFLVFLHPFIETLLLLDLFSSAVFPT